MSTEAMQINPDAPRVVSDFEKELTQLINRYSIENRSDTPDWILAQYVDGCLTAFAVAALRRDQFYGVSHWEQKPLSYTIPVGANTVTNSEK